MKIIAVDHNAIDGTHRGIYRAIASEPDVELTLIVPRRWHDGYRMILFDDTAPDGKPLTIPLDAFLPTRTHRMIYRGLREQIASVRPDILFMNAEPENFQTWQAARILSDFPGTRFVCSSWRNIDHRLRGFPYRLEWLHRVAERTVLERTDHVICYSHEGTEIFHRNGFDKCTYISPVIDTTLFSGPGSGPGAGSLTPFVIGFAGRCIPEKGVDLLLRGVAQLTFEFRLDIVGDGPGLPAWQILAENLGIASRVCWNGSMARDLIPRWLGSLHLLVLPSRTGTTWKEQFGRVLAEAMASGVPVVGSDSGEIPYVIGDAGLVFPEGNAAGLASSIDSIYRMPGLRERLVARGRERCSGVFSVEAQLPNYLGLFRSLTNARKSPGIP